MQANNSSQESFTKSIKAAKRFISYRPRSESEIREKLLIKFSPDLVERTIDLLKSQNTINDSLFAKFWVEKHTNSTLRSSSFIKAELKKKGLETEIIDAATEQINDQHVAYICALKTVKNFHSDQHQVFINKILRSLIYRGFDYSLSAKIAEELWKENSETIA
ncbi:MAG: regulatory protein RecX [Dehalococcoidia bacterium]